LIDGKHPIILFGFQPSSPFGGAGFRWPIHSISIKHWRSYFAICGLEKLEKRVRDVSTWVEYVKTENNT
jgi:hypothetical protein